MWVCSLTSWFLTRWIFLRSSTRFLSGIYAVNSSLSVPVRAAHQLVLSDTTCLHYKHLWVKQVVRWLVEFPPGASLAMCLVYLRLTLRLPQQGQPLPAPSLPFFECMDWVTANMNRFHSINDACDKKVFKYFCFLYRLHSASDYHPLTGRSLPLTF